MNDSFTTAENDHLSDDFLIRDVEDDATGVGNADADIASHFSFLDSLRGSLGAERDRLLDQDVSPEAVAKRIEELVTEAESLRFATRAAAKDGPVDITALITTNAGEQELDVSRLNPAIPAKRTEFALRLAALHPAINPREAERRIMRLAADRNQSPPLVEDNRHSAEQSSEARLQQSPAVLIAEAKAMLENPRLLDRIVEDVHSLGIAGERELILIIYLAGTSRLLPKPLSVIVSAESSTGKTYTVTRTVSCFPPEQVINATSLTANAPYYMCMDNPDALKHKLVVNGERKKRQDASQGDATGALRQLISDGTISKIFTDTSVRPPVTRRIEVNGPISSIETTTTNARDIFEEDLNRRLLLETDSSSEQTQRVVQLIASCRSTPVRADVDAILARHHTAQRMLRQLPVRIPFASLLGEKFPCHRPEARRAFDQLCSMIQASALLHQLQRPTDDEGQLIATLADYEVAAQLCRSPLARLMGGKISNAAIDFYKRLLQWDKANPAFGQSDVDCGVFSTTEACKHDRKSDSAVLRWLKELSSTGAVEPIQPARGNQPARWRLRKIRLSDVETGGFDLPAMSELSVAADPSDPGYQPF